MTDFACNATDLASAMSVANGNHLKRGVCKMIEQTEIILKDVLTVWWRYFWRYAIAFALLLFLGGYLLNHLRKIYYNPELFFWGSLSYGFLLNIIVSFAIFKFIIGKQVGKSELILVPAVVKRNNSDPEQFKVGFFRLFFTWWGYFWRFALFAFAIGFALGATYIVVGGMLGYDTLKLAAYSKYLGNIAVIPASLLVFILLMWRKEKRRKLDIIRVKSPA